jgi:hypothetical protein
MAGLVVSALVASMIVTCTQPRDRTNPYDASAPSYDPKPVISNFILAFNPILTNSTALLQISAFSPKAETLYYEFTLAPGSGALGGSDGPTNKTFTAPPIAGISQVQLNIRSSSGLLASRTLSVTVTSNEAEVRSNSLSDVPTNSGPNLDPMILSFTASINPVDKNNTSALTVIAVDPASGPLTYAYNILAGGGSLVGSDTATGKSYQAPAPTSPGGPVTVRVVVTKSDGKSASADLPLYVNKSWVTLGSAGMGVGASGCAWVSMILDNTGKPVVAFADSNSVPAGRLSVMAWNGSAWNIVGPGPVTATAVTHSSIVWNFSNNQPFVAYNESATGNASQFDGTTWTPLGSLPGSDPTHISAGFDNQAKALVYFRDTSLAKARVYKWIGSWSELGASGFSSADAASGNMAIDALGNPVAAYQDNANSVTCNAWNGTVWNQLGGANFTLNPAPIVSMALDPNSPNASYPVVAVKDMGNSGFPALYRWNGAWSQEGPATGFLVNTLGVAVNFAGEAIIACDANAGNRATVFVKRAGSWQNIGTPAITSSQVLEIKVKILPPGDPIILFRDGSVQFRPTAMVFN